jgi:exonuclease SbcC
VHRAALERAEKAAADAAVAELETSALGAKLARWRLLQQACGKDGIPALELDAAGPEVSRIANELLASTFGARFQIAFETVRLSRDKKKQIETFEIRVFGEGDEQKIEDLSGGEAVWVETAIRLAIAAYMKQKSGRDIASRQFDEADGALSGENAQHYLDMIRKSHDEGGFYFTFIISHRQDLVGQIRQQIIFEKGSGIRLVA